MNCPICDDEISIRHNPDFCLRCSNCGVSWEVLIGEMKDTREDRHGFLFVWDEVEVPNFRCKPHMPFEFYQVFECFGCGYRRVNNPLPEPDDEGVRGLVGPGMATHECGSAMSVINVPFPAGCLVVWWSEEVT